MSVSHVIPLLTPTGDFRFGVVKGELEKNVCLDKKMVVSLDY
jgi:hypothetical protein